MALNLRIMIILFAISTLFIGVSFIKNVDSKLVYPAVISISLEMITKLLYLKDLAINNKPEVQQTLQILYIVFIQCFIMIINTFYCNLRGNNIITFLLFNFMIYAIIRNLDVNIENPDSWPIVLFVCIASNIFKIFFLQIWDNINFLYF
jgi:hypothetical protein